MKKTIILISMFIIMTFGVIAFPPDDIPYFVFEEANQTDGQFYEGTYTVSEKIYTALTGGNLIKSQTSQYTINNGTWVGIINDTGIDYSSQFFIQLEVGGDTLTPRIPYVPSIQTQTALNVTTLNFNNMIYTGKLGINNLSACGNSEILKYSGSAWVCDTDSTGTDTNNYATGVSITGTTTKNITITRSGLGIISVLFTDIDTDTDTFNSTADFAPTFVSRADWTTIDNYPSACSAGDFVTTIGDTLTCDTPSYTVDTDTTRSDAEIFDIANNGSISITESQISDLSHTVDTDTQRSDSEIFDIANNKSILINCDTQINFTNGIGSAGICDGVDATGAGATVDTDTNVTKIEISGTITKTITIVQDDQANKTGTFTDIDTDTFNSTADFAPTFVSRADWTTIDNYPSACSAGDFVTTIGDTLTCATPSYIADTDTTRSDAEIFDIANNGSISITESQISDLSHTVDTNTNANTECSGTTTYYDGEGNCDDISTIYYLATNPSSYITDGNTNWDNSYGFITVDTDTFNSTADFAPTFVARADWTTIDNYPSACSAGDFVTTIGDTLTCDTPSYTVDTDTFNSTADFDAYYVSTTSDTMTGVLTAEGLTLENDVTNHKIYDNSTCIIITGDTSTLSIC